MCSTNTTPPTTCVTGPIDAPTHSHVVPQANKAPRGPTASARDRTRREPASGHFARAPPGPTPRSHLILSTQQKARTSKAYLQDCHDRPADFVSPPVSGGRAPERQNDRRDFEFEPAIICGNTSIRQLNSVSAHQIGKNLILHWNSKDGGEKKFHGAHPIYTREDDERKEKKGCCSLLLSSSFLPLLTKKRIFPQYFSLIKERPKTYSHQKNPDRMSMFDPGVVAAAGPKRKKKK